VESGEGIESWHLKRCKECRALNKWNPVKELKAHKRHRTVQAQDQVESGEGIESQ